MRSRAGLCSVGGFAGKLAGFWLFATGTSCREETWVIYSAIRYDGRPGGSDCEPAGHEMAQASS